MRFDNCAWNKLKIKDYYEIQMCKRIFANQTNLSFGIPFYKIGTLGSKCDSYISYDLFFEYKNKYKFPIKGETLITCSGTVGRCVKYDGNDAYYQDSNIVWLRGNNSPITNDFLYILLSNTDWTKLNSTTISRIYNSNLYSLQYNYPINIDVQNKIVDFFEKINNRIKTQKKIIKNLKSQINQIRCDFFKKTDSTNEKISILKITEEYVSKTYKNNMYPVLSSTQNGIYLQSLYFNKEASSEDTTGYKIIPRGFCTYRSMSDNGIFKFNKQDILDYGIISPAYPVFKTNEMFLTDFLIEYLNYSYYFKNKVLETKEGGTRFALSFSKLKKIDIAYVSKDKQKNYLIIINTFLNKLSNETKILSLYEKQKQYLLNHMFI